MKGITFGSSKVTIPSTITTEFKLEGEDKTKPEVMSETSQRQRKFGYNRTLSTPSVSFNNPGKYEQGIAKLVSTNKG